MVVVEAMLVQMQSLENLVYLLVHRFDLYRLIVSTQIDSAKATDIEHIYKACILFDDTSVRPRGKACRAFILNSPGECAFNAK